MANVSPLSDFALASALTPLEAGPCPR